MQSLSQYTNSDQRNWDSSLSAILFGFRIAPSPTTGESPFYLLHGREPVLPMEVPLKPPTKLTQSILKYRSQLVRQMELTHRVAAEQTQLSQQKMKSLYDRKANPYPYQIGDRVWIYTPKHKTGLSKKLLHCWHGPYRLVEQLSPVTFNVRTMANRLLPYAVHVNRFNPYVDPLARPLDPPIDLPDDTNDILSESDFPLDSFEAAPLKAPPPGHALEQQQLH